MGAKQKEKKGKRRGERRTDMHTEMRGWSTHIFYTLRASVKIAHVSLQKQSTQLVCVDSRQSRISLLLCSHHWSQPTLCLVSVLIVASSPNCPTPPRPSLLPLARGLLLPVDNAQFSRGDGHLLSHHRLHLNPTQVWGGGALGKSGTGGGGGVGGREAVTALSNTQYG